MTMQNFYSLDKQVFLKFYGSLEEDLTVELTIFNQGDRNQPVITVSATGVANQKLADLVRRHWEKEYRPFMTGRGIRPEVIQTGQINLKSCQASAERLAAALNDWLEGSNFKQIRENLFIELSPKDNIQILLQASDRALQQLPWSAWHRLNDYPKATIEFSPLEAKAPELKRSRQYLRILGLFGVSKKSDSDIDTGADRRLLEALQSNLIEVKILDQPDRAQISDQLWQESWDIIVFAGHSETTEEGQGVLYLNERREALSLNNIWYGLRQAVRAGLQLAIFNSCDGLGLLARTLRDDPCIPQMIVMRDVVPDQVAQAFLRFFLDELGQGQAIHLAAKTAREQLEGLEDKYPCASWLPIIWQNPYIASFRIEPPQEEPPASPQSSWRPLKVTGLVATSAIAAFFLRTPAAHFFNQQGHSAYQNNQLLVAQRAFQIAAVLKHDYVAPRYNVAWLLDAKWGRTELAQKWYEEAAFLGFPEAIAQYVRLRLLKPDLSDADYSSLIKLTQRCIEQEPLAGTQASCLKNMGWIRLQQGQPHKAKKPLQDALQLWDDESPHTHCLLAEVFEVLDQPELALPHWQSTLKNGKESIHEQMSCIYKAEQKLEGLEN